MNNYKKTQWHPPFVAAVRLELRENKKDLLFEPEKILNSKPIQLDLLVIKKPQNIAIQNEIGQLFRTHNIFEYKSPEDTLNLDAYFKTLAYACLYKANAPSSDEIKADTITISLVHESMPKKLIKWFLGNGCQITETFPGIYYVTGNKVLFPTQLIVTERLGIKEHQWLKSLTAKMSPEIGTQLIHSANTLSDKDDKEHADSILQLAMAENSALFNYLKEVPDMCEALNTLMKPELDAARSEGEAKGRSEGKIEGITIGATELATAIRRLKRGETVDNLIKDGLSEDIVKSAKDIIDEL